MKNSKAFGLFVDELKELLSQIETLEQQKWETDNNFSDILKKDFHKTKGAAGMFGFSELANLASELENRFGANLRDTLSNNLESKALVEQLKIVVEKILTEER